MVTIIIIQRQQVQLHIHIKYCCLKKIVCATIRSLFKKQEAVRQHTRLRPTYCRTQTILIIPTLNGMVW